MPNQRYILITGATSGIGKAAAMQLAADGAVVIATSRSAGKGADLLEDYRKAHPRGKGRIELVECDLASFESISMACEEVLESYHHLDVLINNAGLMAYQFGQSRDKIEMTWQVNLLAPMLIIHLLLPGLKKAQEPKIIMSTSGFHVGRMDLEDPEFKNKRYVSWQAYRQSKLGLILLTRLLAPRFTEDEIGIYAQHPGLVKTGIDRSAPGALKMLFSGFGMSPEKGAETLLYLVNNSNEDLISGEYYTKSNVAKSAPGAYDLDEAEKLLELIKGYLKKYITEASLIFP